MDSQELPTKRARVGPDLKITVDDGELEVHSLILELASPVFASMLNSSMKEGYGATIDLPGKRKRELETFYKSLQLCSMEPLTKETARFLTQWADEYQVDPLKAKCDEFLMGAPVDGPALQFAVKYGLPRRTKQCLDIMKTDLAQNIHQLHVLTDKDCVQHLADFWPLIIRQAGVPSMAMPAPEVLKSMWPFLAQAVRCTPQAVKFAILEKELKTFPGKLYNHLPSSSQSDRKGEMWMTEQLQRLNVL
ncbi:unnamed protein product [Symbiodinium natans]|uniref:BTB domain-containing protein n=1 Tax=Symbiodinium natans TaxID=878477 RepID=A0A812JTV1_9DINO|nr:unnamed protein product [Symbiodinium natans]